MPSQSAAFPTLDTVLEAHAARGGQAGAVAALVRTIADTSIRIAALISEGPLGGNLAAAVGGNVQGEVQKALDVQANDMLIAACQDSPAFSVASEELELPVAGRADGTVLVAFDPLDGSSNIDVNLSIGTIFSILPRPAGSAEPTDPALFLQTGRQQLAAGYVLYGPQTMLVLTLGAGTDIFTLDRAGGQFLRTTERAAVPPTTREYAINASNARHWPEPIRQYIDHCVAGTTGPRGEDTNLRWVASLVAEAHRVIVRGGVFLYPGDNRPGYAQGRLRLLYEAAPMAMLIEQAGGRAITGQGAVLDLVPGTLHQRASLIFGSRDEVARIESYHAL